MSQSINIYASNLTDHAAGATSIAHLTAAQQKLYQWEYERWERKDLDKTIAAKHLYLIENKDTLYERLTTLKKHLAPSDATRQRDLIARYKALQTPPRSRKVEEWLRSWVEVTNMCISAEVPETIGSRAQEDFLVACRTIDPEYGTSGLRALIDLEDAGTAIPSVEDYVSKFTTYLKRVRPTLINTEHPRRPKTYANALGRKKLDAALAADNDLRDKINKALDKWRAKQQESGGSIAIDDGNRPTRPTANTVRYIIQDQERSAQDYNETTHNNRVETNTIADDSLKPKGNLYTAVSMEEDIDKLSNRWILDPSSNTHVINTEEWSGWTREYNAVATDFVGAGTGRVQITAWGSMELMANTPIGVRSLRLTHVAYVQGFITSLISLARCRKLGIHFDSGRDLLRPKPMLLSSFGTTYRPSKAPRPDQKVDARMAHQMWAHPGKKAIEKLTSNVDGLVIKGDTNDFCAVCTESKLTKQISRRQQEDQAQKPFYRIAVDVIQLLPQGEACLNGDRWARHSVDQYSKWHQLIQDIRSIQRVFDCDITAIKTDNERGYGTSPNFLEELCRDLGIRYEPRAEYTEEQNRLAERVGSLLVIRARAIRIQKTPYEIVWKTKPKVQHMRPIGCRAYVLNRSLKRGDKLESRALIGHLVGYDSTNIFRIWLPTKDQVIRTRDVVFEPTKFYDGPQGYARESIIEEVIELLSFPEEFELDDIAIEDLLTSRQRRQQQPSHASALPRDVNKQVKLA
ncbi:hypothetical protein KJE20_02068 [Pyrenophora tritici-repentis]|nr:hypothetical protein KJE20_02068 [Pyrenophora tritici-repentis]